jgi:Tfp pilus assembly protein PilF
VKAFGVSIRTLGRELIAYVENGRFRAFRIPKHNFATESQPSLRPLRRDEIANELGWIALSGNPARAQRYFEAAIAANPEYARAHAGLGDAYKFQKRWDEARPHYERALALAPDDALNQLEYAEYLHERAKAEEDPEERVRLVRQARQHYVRSQNLDPDLPETYAMYGASFLVEGEDPERGLDTLEHARAMLRSNLDIQLMLAQLYMKTGRRAEARDLLETVVTWAHGEDLADEADVLLAELNGPRGENPTDRRD